MAEHARLSPSASERWMSCPGSIRLCELHGLSSSMPSAFSAEGTFAHSIRARALAERRPAADFVGLIETVDGFEITCTPEMAANLQPGIDRLLGEADSPDATFLVEQAVDLSMWVPDSFGTADAVVHGEELVIVDDLKYGAGVPVEAEHNPQLMLYALGVLAVVPTVERILVRIDQPRVAGGGSQWEISREALVAFGERVHAAAMRTLLEDADLVPSDHACRWCPAQAKCPAMATRALELTGFTNLDTPALPESLTPEQRSVILRHKDRIEKWLESLHAEAMADALYGRPVPGFKAIEGRRGNRVWADDLAARETLAELLGDKAITTKTISPAEAEKLLGKKAKIPMTVQAPGKPCLVAEDDRRPAITTADKAFDVLPSDQNIPWD